MQSEPKTRTPLAALALSLAMQAEGKRQRDPDLEIAGQDLAETAVTSHRPEETAPHPNGDLSARS